jgi:hypothetical protein
MGCKGIGIIGVLILLSILTFGIVRTAAGLLIIALLLWLFSE